jgi:hypothetical protein
VLYKQYCTGSGNNGSSGAPHMSTPISSSIDRSMTPRNSVGHDAKVNRVVSSGLSTPVATIVPSNSVPPPPPSSPSSSQRGTPRPPQSPIRAHPTLSLPKERIQSSSRTNMARSPLQTSTSSVQSVNAIIPVESSPVVLAAPLVSPSSMNRYQSSPTPPSVIVVSLSSLSVASLSPNGMLSLTSPAIPHALPMTISDDLPDDASHQENTVSSTSSSTTDNKQKSVESMDDDRSQFDCDVAPIVSDDFAIKTRSDIISLVSTIISSEDVTMVDAQEATSQSKPIPNDTKRSGSPSPLSLLNNSNNTNIITSTSTIDKTNNNSSVTAPTETSIISSEIGLGTSLASPPSTNHGISTAIDGTLHGEAMHQSGDECQKMLGLAATNDTKLANDIDECSSKQINNDLQSMQSTMSIASPLSLPSPSLPVSPIQPPLQAMTTISNDNASCDKRASSQELSPSFSPKGVSDISMSTTKDKDIGDGTFPLSDWVLVSSSSTSDATGHNAIICAATSSTSSSSVVATAAVDSASSSSTSRRQIWWRDYIMQNKTSVIAKGFPRNESITRPPTTQPGRAHTIAVPSPSTTV